MKQLTLLSMILCLNALGAENSVAIWHLDESSGQVATDCSVYGNNGQLSSASGVASNDPLRTAGKFGSALQFNGSSSFLQAPNSASLSITGSITLEAWVKLDSFNLADPIIAKWNDLAGTNDRGYSLTLQQGFLRFDVSHTGKFLGACSVQTALSFACSDSALAFSFAPITLHKWTHVAGVFDSSTNTLSVYIDGTLSNSVVAEHSNIFSNAEPVLIGASDSGGSTRQFFGGAIDEVRVWQRPLSSAEVLSSAQAGLRGLWHFNGDGTDGSGLGNDTGIVGATFTPTSKFGGSALSVDGVDDFAFVPDSTSISITGPITVEAWVYLHALPQGTNTFAPIMAKWNDQNLQKKRSYALAITPDGSVRFDVSHTGGFSCGSFKNFGPFSCASVDSALVISAAKVALNTWTHIAGVFDGQTLQVFVNGQPDQSIGTKASNIFRTDALPAAFGFANEGSIGPQFTNGIIDEAHLWGRALSSVEIAFEANGTTAAELHLPDLIGQDGLTNHGGGNGNGAIGETELHAGAVKQVMFLEFVSPDAPGVQIMSIEGHSSNGDGASLLGAVTGNSSLDALITGKTVNPPSLNFKINLNDKSKLGVQFEWQ